MLHASPAQIHCVRAYGAVHDKLRALRLDVPVVLHSWTGSADMTVALLQLPRGFISLSGHLLRVPPHKAVPMVGDASMGVAGIVHAQQGCWLEQACWWCFAAPVVVLSW